MIKRHRSRVLFPVMLAAMWWLLTYSLLFGGFSVALADYYWNDNPNNLKCVDVTNCRSLAGCGGPGSVGANCTLTCQSGSVVYCNGLPR